MFFRKISAYFSFSGGFWRAPGGTPGTHPMPPWLIQIPDRSRRLFGRYGTVPHFGSTGCVFAAASKVVGSFEASRGGAWTPLDRSRSTGRPIRSSAAVAPAQCNTNRTAVATAAAAGPKALPFTARAIRNPLPSPDYEVYAHIICVESAGQTGSQSMQDSMNTIEHVKATLLDLAIRFGPRLLVAILILIIGALVSRGVSRWMARALNRVELEPPVRQLLARIAWLITMVLFVILALQNLGVELLPLIAGLGVVGAGLALATQGVLSNVVAGLSIIFTKPFRVGEYISIVKEEGTVESITLFNTTLGHPDRSRVVIPNRKITGEILHNFGKIR